MADSAEAVVSAGEARQEAAKVAAAHRRQRDLFAAAVDQALRGH